MTSLSVSWSRRQVNRGNSMQFPLNISEHPELLPHRDPMVWVDCILEADGQSGRTAVTLDRSLMLIDDRLYTGALIEFVAQSYGFIMALEVRGRGERLKLTQLASIDHFELLTAELPPAGATLTAELSTTRDMHPLYLVNGLVYTDSGEQLCEINFKGFARFESEDAD